MKTSVDARRTSKEEGKEEKEAEEVEERKIEAVG